GFAYRCCSAGSDDDPRPTIAIGQRLLRVHDAHLTSAREARSSRSRLARGHVVDAAVVVVIAVAARDGRERDSETETQQEKQVFESTSHGLISSFLRTTHRLI